MRVAIYARFSSDLQDVRSITDQLALAREYATQQGWQIVAEFTDAAISGASIVNRRGLQDLLRAAEARQRDAVLTESLDRLSRDLADSAGLHKQLAYWGVRIVTLDDGDVNKMHVAVKGLLGSMFLDDLAQKSKRGQVGRVKAGRIPRGPVLRVRRCARGRGAREAHDQPSRGHDRAAHLYGVRRRALAAENSAGPQCREGAWPSREPLERVGAARLGEAAQRPSEQ